MKRLSWFLPLFLLMNSGCLRKSPLENVTPQVAIPAEVKASSSVSTIDPTWWRAFDDPRLNTFVEAALERNPDIRQAAARLARAEAAARIADANRLPSVDVSADGRRQKQNFIGFPIPGSDGGVASSTATTLGISLNTRWEVDLWGRLRAGSREALAEAQASAADWQGVLLSIAGQAVKAYVAVAEATSQEALAEATVSSYRSNLEQVRNRYEQGLRGSLDLRLAGANLAQAESQLVARQQQRQRAVRQLESLMGRYPSGDLLDGAALPDLPKQVPSGLPADIIQRRPDVAAAERRLAAADQRWIQADRQRYPSFNLTVSGGTSSGELGDLLDGNFSVWSLLAGLSQPIFQAGRIQANIEVAAADIDLNLAAFTKTVLQAFTEVENALADEHHLKRQLDALNRAETDSTAALELAESRYRQGLDIYLNVLESQRRALQSQSDRIAAQANLLTNRIDMYLALGGGFEFDIETDRLITVGEGE